MNQEKLETGLSDLPLGLLRYYDRVGSTNTEAEKWAAEGAPDLSLVVADEQTAGRGRRGRRWVTSPGAALAFSLVLRERPITGRLADDGASFLIRLTALGALAVSDALRQAYGLEAEIKWPNDVLLDRRKAAGILAEAFWRGGELSSIVLGIGINVAPAAVPPAETLVFPAVSVETVLGRPVDRLELLHDVLARLLVWRLRLDRREFVQTWEDRLAFRGEQVAIFAGLSQAEEPLYQGELLGLNPQGSLMIREAGGEISAIQNGEIRLRPAGMPPE